MAAKRKLNKTSNYAKSPMAYICITQIRNKPKYENEEDKRCISFNNYGSDWYGWHYLIM